MSESSDDQDLLAQWRSGDATAAKQLFDRYVEQLMGVARRRISQRLAARIDAEDVVQSVFRTFFHRARQGQFQVEEADDLCKLLARITIHKTFRQIAFHTRGKRDIGQETPLGDDESWVNYLAREPTPEEAAALLDQMEHFLAQLPPQDRQVLQLRLEGHSTAEIAAKLSVTDRTIRRTLERMRALAQPEGRA